MANKPVNIYSKTRVLDHMESVSEGFYEKLCDGCEPLDCGQQKAVFGFFSNYIHKAKMKILNYTLDLEHERDMLESELKDARGRIQILENELEALSQGGYLWK
jgi:hypothetical protein